MLDANRVWGARLLGYVSKTLPAENWQKVNEFEPIDLANY